MRTADDRQVAEGAETDVASTGDRRIRAVLLDRTFLILLGVALALRLGWLFFAQPEPVSDFAVHRNMAMQLAETGSIGPTADRLPVYIAVLAVAALVSTSVLWLGFINVVLSTLTCAAVYLLALEVFGRRRPALVATAVCAIAPTFVLFSAVLATENLFALLMVLALVLAFRASKGSIWLAVAAGLVTGLAILTRGEAVFYIPVLVLVLLLARPRSTAPQMSRRLQQSGIAVAAILVVVLPWYVRNTIVVASDAGLSTTTGLNLYLGHNPTAYGWDAFPGGPLEPLDHVERNTVGRRLALEYVRDNPGSLLSSAFNGTVRLYGPPEYAWQWSTSLPLGEGDLVHPTKDLPLTGATRVVALAGGVALLVTAALAFVGVRAWPRRLLLLLIPLLAASWFAHAVVFYARARYRHVSDAVLTLAVAFVLLALWNARPAPGHKRNESAES